MKKNLLIAGVTMMVILIAGFIVYTPSEKANQEIGTIDATTQSVRKQGNDFINGGEIGELKICVKFGFIDKCSKNLDGDCSGLFEYLGITQNDLPSGVSCHDTLNVNSCDQFEKVVGMSLESLNCSCDENQLITCIKPTINSEKSNSMDAK